MGDRALFGFRINGKDKLTYTKWEGLLPKVGKRLMFFLKDNGIDNLRKYADELIAVDYKEKEIIQELTKEFKEKYKDKYSELHCAMIDECHSEEDYFYCYLSNCSISRSFFYDNNLKHPYIINDTYWLTNAPLTDYVFILNFDTNKYETHIGSDLVPKKGRYCNMLADDYDEEYPSFGVRLLDELDFEKILKMKEYEIDNYIEKLSKKVSRLYSILFSKNNQASSSQNAQKPD